MAMAILCSHHHHPLRYCSSPQFRFRRIDQRPRGIAYPLYTRLKLSRSPSLKLDEPVSTFIERCLFSLRLSPSSRPLKHGKVGETNVRTVSCSQAKQSDHHGIDSEPAEWINTAMHDPMVEVDPVTVCHQILAEKQSRPLEESTALVETTAPASQQRLVRFSHITIASVIALFLLAVVGILQYLKVRKTGERQRRNKDVTLPTNSSEPSRAETRGIKETIGANAETKGMTETIGASDGAFKATAAVIADNAAVERPPFSKDVTDQNGENLRSDYEDMVLEQSSTDPVLVDDPEKSFLPSTVPVLVDEPEESFFPKVFSRNNETEQNITLTSANESLEQKTVPVLVDEPEQSFFSSTVPVLVDEPEESFFPKDFSRNNETEQNITLTDANESLEQKTVPVLVDEPEQSFFPKGFSTNNETEQNITLTKANESLEQETVPVLVDEPEQSFFPSTVPVLVDEPEESFFPKGLSRKNETEQNITLTNANESLKQKTVPVLVDEPEQSFFPSTVPVLVDEPEESFFPRGFSRNNETKQNITLTNANESLEQKTVPVSVDEPEQSFFPSTVPVLVDEPEESFFPRGFSSNNETKQNITLTNASESLEQKKDHTVQIDQDEALNIEGDWSTSEMPDTKGLTEGQMDQKEELNPTEMPDVEGLTEGQMGQNEELNLHTHKPSEMADNKGLMGQKLAEDQWFDLELYNRTERGRLMDPSFSSSQIDPENSAETESGQLMDPWLSSSQTDPAASAKSGYTRLGQGHNGGISTIDSLPDIEEVLEKKPPVELAAKDSVPSFWSSDDLLTASSSPAELSTHGLSSSDLQIPSNSLTQPQLDNLRVLEAPELPPFESSEIANEKASEQDRESYTKALEPALPATFVAMGTVGTLLGVAGGLQVVGFAAAARFISRDLFLAESREAFWQELRSITDRQKLRDFLIKRNIVKDY